MKGKKSEDSRTNKPDQHKSGFKAQEQQMWKGKGRERKGVFGTASATTENTVTAA